MNQTISLMQTKSKTIWEAFGSYIAKTMRGGRGIWVPKFGIFTFSAMNVDLAVSTSNKSVITFIFFRDPPTHRSEIDKRGFLFLW